MQYLFTLNMNKDDQLHTSIYKNNIVLSGVTKKLLKILFLKNVIFKILCNNILLSSFDAI